LPSTNALPRPSVGVRAAPTDSGNRPQYSVIPLEPDEDAPNQPGQDNGDSDDGGDGEDQDSTVTLIQTVTHMPDPVTHRVTHTAEPDVETITKKIPIPTTVVSIIDLEGEPTTTVYVTRTPLPPAPVPKPVPAPKPVTTLKTTGASTTSTFTTTSIPGSSFVSLVVPTPGTTTASSGISGMPELPDAPTNELSYRSTLPTPATPTTPLSQGTVATELQPIATLSAQEPVTFTPTTFSTLIRPSQSGTNDDGQWHTSYPPGNQTAAAGQAQH
jgi:hypothetical protein